jgi:hypothetical protein
LLTNKTTIEPHKTASLLGQQFNLAKQIAFLERLVASSNETNMNLNLYFALTLLGKAVALSGASRHAQHSAPNATYPELSDVDLARAVRNNVPKNSPLLSHDDSGTSVASHLNQWLSNNVHSNNLVECEAFASRTDSTGPGLGLLDLNNILEALVERSSPALQAVYKSKCDTMLGCDKRTLRYGKVQDFLNEWQEELNDIESQSSDTLRNAVFEVLRNGKCYEPVQIFYHSLSESARNQYLRVENNVIPMLPKSHDAVKLLANLYVQMTQDTTSKPTDEKRALSRFQKNTHSHLYEEAKKTNNDEAPSRLRGRQLKSNNQGEIHQHLFSNPLPGARALQDHSIDPDLLHGILRRYSKQSPCELAHRWHSPPWNVETAQKAGISKEVAEGIVGQLKHETFKPHDNFAEGIPDTAIPDSGYVSCNAAEQCLAGGMSSTSCRPLFVRFEFQGQARFRRTEARWSPLAKAFTFRPDHSRQFRGPHPLGDLMLLAVMGQRVYLDQLFLQIQVTRSISLLPTTLAQTMVLDQTFQLHKTIGNGYSS